jgi:hypothetical protein
MVMLHLFLQHKALSNRFVFSNGLPPYNKFMVFRDNFHILQVVQRRCNRQGYVFGCSG